jgi:hypothetical protein
MAYSTEATKAGHVHGEAFMLMWYACKSCDHREQIWNSRDGVTPFGCGCPSCGKIMNHEDWSRDVYAPNHIPRNGQKFWRDGTPEEAETIMRQRIDRFMGTKYEPTPETAAELIRRARNESDDGEFRKGWPMLSIAVAD